MTTTPTHLLQHGVFMNIFGTGVLLTGDSGIGKSELALALLDRGHQLIADDIVELIHQDDEIIGQAPAQLRNFLEIRGLGIFNIKRIFGDAALVERQILSMIIHLQKVDSIPRETAPKTQPHQVQGKMISRSILPFVSNRCFELLVEVLVRNFQLQPQPSLTYSGILS